MKVVIIQTAFIGDVILCTPVISSLVRNGHEVGVIVKPEAANIFDSDGRIEHLHVYDKRGKDSGISGLLRMSRELRECSYDAAVIPHRSIRSALLARISRISLRSGFTTSAGSRLFTHRIPYDKNAHEVIRNQSLLEPLKITDDPPPPRIVASQDERETVNRQFNSWNVRKSDTILGIGPGSKWFTKQWGTERYRALAELILEKTEYKVMCFGGLEERSLCDEICSPDTARLLNAAGVFNLKQSAAALERIRLVVSNDNGFMHLAAASGTTVIAIFGPTVPAFGFAPWGSEHTIIERSLECRPCSIHGTASCPEKHFRCMKEITPEDVFQTIEQRIAHHNS